jgi:hypothetical protein
MKRLTLTLVSIVLTSGWAVARPTELYENTGTVTNLPYIDTLVFENNGNFDLSGISIVSNATIIAGGAQAAPFQTYDTKSYINLGFMTLEPGMIFDKATGGGSGASTSFYNGNSIVAFDTPIQGVELIAQNGYYAPPIVADQEGFVGYNAPVPSLLQVNAANITNTGILLVGDNGLVSLSGENVSLAHGAVAAGTVSGTDTNGNSDRGLLFGYLANNVTNWVYSAPVGVSDLYWGLSNAETLDLSALSTTIGAGIVQTPLDSATNRIGISTNYSLPETGVQNFFAYVYEVIVVTNTATNIYENIVLVNASTSASITNNVEFLGSTNGGATEAIVQFSERAPDVITGLTATNVVCLLDTGAIQAAQMATNLEFIGSGYGKPDCFEITTITPYEWALGVPANAVFTTNMIYGTNLFMNATATSVNASYAVQVGANNQELDGLFALTKTLELTNLGFDMPPLTDRPGRLEIRAKHLDLSNARIRANGGVSLSVTNPPTGQPASDFDCIDVNMGNLNTSLSVSNLIPAKFERLRGDVLAWSANWVNTLTNGGLGNVVAETVNTHLLVVDQNLQGSFTPSVINVALRGGEVTLSDPVLVLVSDVFHATNLTFNNLVHLTGSAAGFGLGNTPGLEHLLLTTNAALTADSQINLGVPTGKAPANPVSRKYLLNSVTNQGAISSTGLEFQPVTFVNNGSLLCTNGGSILMYARTNIMGVGNGAANSLIADGSIDISSVCIQWSNTTILAGQDGTGQLNLYASSQLTDFYPNTPSTNTYVTNLVQVTDGFNLTNKPASGDLFGTQILTSVTNFGEVVNHVWAGQDLGPTNLGGFYNNEVIGHLILDRQTNNAALRFSAAGKQNAMYVDYLELRDLSFSDYETTSGLIVDPNFTIYFAKCNLDPTKLTQLYPNVVWVPQFAGPNSSAVVEYLGGSNCLMNALVATSSEISSDFDGVPNSKKYPYILDNTNNPYVGTLPCPSTVEETESLIVTNGTNFQSLVVFIVGEGLIGGIANGSGVEVGKTLNLTATPTNANWLFLNWSYYDGSNWTRSTLSELAYKVPATNVLLTATFIPNPFPVCKGAYNGLFYPTNGVTGGSSGFAALTLSASGAFSGHLQIAASKYPFASKFNSTGMASVNTTNGTNHLSVTLQLDPGSPGGAPPQITGQVSNGTWESPLTNDLAPVWTAKNPAPQEGYYTMALPGNPGATNSPGGDSWGTATVSKTGNVKAVLNLADGAGVSVSQSAPVSALGLWPLYFYTSKGAPQTVLGWVGLGTNPAVSFATNSLVNWIRGAGPGGYYTNGFTNSAVLLGGVYEKTNRLSLTNPVVTLSGGNLEAVVSEPVSVSGKVTYEDEGKDLKLTINQATGGVTGQYEAEGSRKKTPLEGVVLQGQGVVRGFFLGTNESGAAQMKGE